MVSTVMQTGCLNKVGKKCSVGFESERFEKSDPHLTHFFYEVPVFDPLPFDSGVILNSSSLFFRK